MKVLFYEDPLTDQNAFLWRLPHVQRDAPWLLALLRSGVEAKMILQRRFRRAAVEVGVPEHSLVEVDEELFLAALPDPQININTQFQKHHDAVVGDLLGDDGASVLEPIEETVRSFSAIVKQALKNFAPDVILVWSPAPHLRRLFPDALILHKETSVFTRSPYPTTYYLDPCGFLQNSALVKSVGHPKDISEKALRSFSQIKTALNLAFEAGDNTRDLLGNLDKFERTILAASHTNGAFFHDAACDYRSQMHFVLDVLDSVPPDCGVVVSQHPDCQKLTAAEVNFLKDGYPNFIFWPELLNRPGSGQYLVRHVNAVATVSGSVGMQALFWGKPLFVMGKNQLTPFACGVGRDGLKQWVERPIPEATLAWLLFNYSMSDSYAAFPDRLAVYLKQKLGLWRHSRADGYFDEPAADEEIVTKHLLANIDRATREAIGPPLGHLKVDALPIDRADLFGPGWFEAEDARGRPYRWTSAARSALKLPLAPGEDRIIDVRVATHTACDPHQVARLVIGDVALAEQVVSTLSPPSQLRGLVRAEQITAPITEIWLETAVMRSPYEGAPNHGLITSDISVGPARSKPSIFVRPLHSILIPTLNGVALLKETLPTILEQCPRDVEVVVSDNRSDDGTWAYLRAQNDPRLKIVQPPQRLDYGRHADFCYHQAQGEWISHLGDDDVILPQRFEIIEAATKYGADIIFAGRLRYYWPEFPEPQLANSLDATRFDDVGILMDGADLARRLINNSNIRHTGAVTLHRSLVEKVRNACRGVFMPERLGEYFAYRVASGLAGTAAFINRPIVVIGRHKKSIGTSLHHPTGVVGSADVDLEREIGSNHPGTGYNFLGQQPFSFEATLRAVDILSASLAELRIDYSRWKVLIESDLASQAAKGRLSHDDFEAIKRLGDVHFSQSIDHSSCEPPAFGTPQSTGASWGWDSRMRGVEGGFTSISGAADWFSSAYAQEIENPIKFYPLNDVQVDWIDA